MFYSTENLCFDVVCMFYARGPVRMDVSYRESRVARDPANRPEMRVKASNKAIVCYEMSHLDMYVHEQDS